MTPPDRPPDVPVDPLTPTEAQAQIIDNTLPAVGPTTSSSPSIQAYQLGEVLGRGGMGEVVLAHDPQIGRDVALKRMRAGQPSPDMIERFLREAKIQARLDHPAIVPVHELGYEPNGLPYFTMKRLAGRTLAALLEAGTETPQRLLRGLVDVCLAVQFAHTRNVIHRDLKPSNIILGDFGEVYVLDWGVARVLVDSRTSQPVITNDIYSLDGETKTGALLGTPGYMAPEQVRGESVTTAVDVYALGALLFEILTRAPLHPRGHAALASTLGAHDTSPAKRDPAREIAPELDAACIAALDPAPFARPTAGKLAELIQAYLDGDRDLEKRRTVAREHLVAARAAISSNDPARRAEAVFEAGRALVFDPQSLEAAELVTTLILEPPARLPAELESQVLAEEQQGTRYRSKRALVPMLIFFVMLPLGLLLTVISRPMLIGLIGCVGGTAALSFINWRVRPIPVWTMMLANFCLTIMFSRLNGPFILTPLMIAGVLLALTPVPWLNDRRWFVLLFTALLVMTPFALEEIGAFPRTWWTGQGGIVSAGNIFGSNSSADAIALVIGNLVFALLIASYALALSRDRRIAQRTLRIQAWHLEQLIPRARGIRGIP